MRGRARRTHKRTHGKARVAQAPRDGRADEAARAGEQNRSFLCHAILMRPAASSSHSAANLNIHALVGRKMEPLRAPAVRPARIHRYTPTKSHSRETAMQN